MIRSSDDGPNGRVQPRAVASPGEDADSHEDIPLGVVASTDHTCYTTIGRYSLRTTFILYTHVSKYRAPGKVTSRQQPVASSATFGSKNDEADLIAKARGGSTAAFNQLVLAWQDLAFNVALRLVGDSDTAADVTQDAFLSAYRHLDQFKGGSFRSWILRIVTNASYDVLRSRQHKRGQSLDDLIEETAFDPPDPGELPEAMTLRHEFAEQIQIGLDRLPVDQRAVLVMYDIHGLSYEEIGVALQVNLGPVKSRLSRARGRLRDYLMGHPELWKA